jgi:RNA polymerase sigma-70 factor (ECF subfamily)
LKAKEVIPENIIAGCCREDIKSQSLLYRNYYGYGMAVALRYCSSRETACEVINDSFLKVFQKINQYRTDCSFKSWFRKIIINTAIDYYRQNLKHTVNDSLESNSSEGDNTLLNDIIAEDLIKIIQKLPDAYRMVFNMYELEGYSHEEIGLLLKISASTSRANLTRAKMKLRILINQHYERV